MLIYKSMEIKFWSPGEREKTVTHTQGSWIHYSNGQRCLDVQCGNMAYILGYQNNEIATAVANNPVNFIRGNTGETSADNNKLVKWICELGQWAALTWAVSGSDAVEAAMAMNDTYWQTRGLKKHKILSFAGSYHGTTMLAKHLRGQYEYLNRSVLVPSPSWQYQYQQHGQEKLTLTRIQKTLKENPDIGCLIMETVSWAQHMAPHSTEYWQSLRNICTEHDVLMIVDDVAFCWGTNGTMFGYEPYGIQPDICTIGKSLTNGYSPLGAACCNEKVLAQIDTQNWLHGHTWQPNMSGVAAALSATQQIQTLLPQAAKIHQRLTDIATELDLNCRGANTFMSFDFDRVISFEELYRLAKFSAALWGDNSVKVFAPLTADDEYFDALRTGLQRLSTKPV
jgi:adenosylmethionine-8-amino-7-oxononanoate aminotransferase